MLVVKYLASNPTTMTVVDTGGELYFAETGRSPGSDTTATYYGTANDFDFVRAEVRTIREIYRAGWGICTKYFTVITVDRRNSHIEAALEAFHEEHLVLSRTWNEIVPRARWRGGLSAILSHLRCGLSVSSTYESRQFRSQN
jgi:hypothetical protein